MTFFVNQPIMTFMSPTFGERLLTALEGTLLWPTNFGEQDYFRHKADGLSKSELVSRWPFVWKSDICFGMWSAWPLDDFRQVTIMDVRAPLTECGELFRRCVKTLRPECAVASALTPDVFARGLEQVPMYKRRPNGRLENKPFCHHYWLKRLQGALPDVHWLNAFGSHYIEKIGRDVLTSAPRASMSIEDDLIVIESCRVEELGTPAAGVACDRIREHIGTKFFM